MSDTLNSPKPEDGEQEILISMDEAGVHLVAQSVQEKFAKKKISASLITSLNNCPAKWAAESFAIRDLVKEEPDNAARRGSLFHKVMEDLFRLPAEERTKENVKRFLNDAFDSDDFSDLKGNPDVLAWVRDAINGYYSMGGRPEKVKVATLMRDGKEQLGIELFVSGTIGEAKRPVIGFIDRLGVAPKKEAEGEEDEFEASAEEELVVEDWKSGAKPKRWNPKTKSEDGLGEARQQVIYTMLLEKEGYKVASARLIFPVARTQVPVDIKDSDFRLRVIKDIEDADKALDHYSETNTFEYRPNFLCSWCPLAKICPKVQRKPFEKARLAYASQPAPEVLLRGIEIV